MSTNNYHVGRRYQRGRGIGSVFGTIFRSIIPIGKKILNSATTKTIAKSVGRSLKEAAVDTALDALEGKNIKEAAQERLDETKAKIAKAIRKRGQQHKNMRKKNPKLKKSKAVKDKNYYLLN